MIKKLTILVIIITVGYFFINLIIGTSKFKNLKEILNDQQRITIKKIFFPYKLISQQNQLISNQQKLIYQQRDMIDYFKESIDWSNIELNLIKHQGNDILTKKTIIKLSDNLKMENYKLEPGFYAGIWNTFPGSAYIEFKDDNLIILSSRGILAFRENLDHNQINFTQIKNNINEFIGLEQFKKNNGFSLKDIHIFNDKIFISYTEEIIVDCWNTSIIYGEINYEAIKFKKLFSPSKCIHSINNIDNEFNSHQSGGKIISWNDNHILLSIGDYRSRYLAQDKQSINGKIIKINIENNNYEIISMGHRNPQGLYFDKENNFILSTEHGPKGGDEINLIEVNEIGIDNIPNYGWAISSMGEHYSSVSEENIKKYPLYKSHNEYNFIEPLHSFVPSIGISEIVKIGQNRYVVSSLRDKSLYFFELNEQKQIINLNRIEVFERVRDLRFKDNQLYLFLEDTASIGVIKLN